MPTMSLDDFVAGLQASMARAQANIAEGNRGRLERQIELVNEGRAETLTWSLVMDKHEGGAIRTLRFPLMAMSHPLTPQVTELTLELKAVVETAPAPAAAGRPRRLRFIARRTLKSARQRLHALTVRLVGKQPGIAEISLDGAPLRKLTARPQPAGGGT